MKKAAVLVGCVLLLGACEKPPPSPPPEETPVAAPSAPVPVPAPELTAEAKRWSWIARSDDRRITVSQSLTAPGRCRIESSGASPEWTSDECLGDRDDLHFVSPDGARLLVLRSLPDVGDDWRTASVVGLYERGALIKETNAGALLSDDSKLRMFSTHFSWLRGVNGSPGSAPHYGDRGFVDGTLASGEPLHLGFDGSGIPAPLVTRRAPAQAAADGPPSCDGTFVWTDGSGEDHYTDSFQDVPAAFRKKVRCSSGGDVFSVSGGIRPTRQNLQGIPEASPGVPAAAQNKPPPAAPAPMVFCRFKYEKKRPNNPHFTYTGPGDIYSHEYCVEGPLSRAQAECERNQRPNFFHATACLCTDDQTYIGTRCDD